MQKLKLLFAVAALLLIDPAFALDNSQFVKVTPLLKTTTSWDNKPIVYPQGQAQITGLIVEIAVGGETGWHEHPVPSFGVLLQGTLEVSLEDGQVKRLTAGDALAEVISTAHNGRNVGDVPVKIAVFYAGNTEIPLTIAHPELNQPNSKAPAKQ